MAKRPDFFIRLSLDYADHPKIAGLSDAAFRAHIEMILYSRRYLTDGQIAKQIAKRWPEQVLSELQTNDAAQPSLTRSEDGGYLLHGYSEMQETRDEVAHKRRIRAESGRKGGLAKAKQSAKQPASKLLSKNVPEVEVEVEVEVKESDRDRGQTLEHRVTDDAYQAVGKAFNFIAVRGIAKWALTERQEPPQRVRDALVGIHEMGKPITKQTLAHYLDGKLGSPAERRRTEAVDAATRRWQAAEKASAR